MRPRAWMALVAAGTLPLAVACGGQEASPGADAAASLLDGGAGTAADGESDAADAESDAGDVGDAADAAEVPPAPPLPSWSEEAFPEKRSPMPKKGEWESAPRVAIDRAAPEDLFQSREGGGQGCEARRLREWIQLRCDRGGGMLLIGGNADGVSLLRDKDAVFPVRRGDRRVIELFAVSETVNAHTTEVIARQALPGLVISEQWIAGDERPSLVAADYKPRPR